METSFDCVFIRYYLTLFSIFLRVLIVKVTMIKVSLNVDDCVLVTDYLPKEELSLKFTYLCREAMLLFRHDLLNFGEKAFFQQVISE